MRFNRRHEKLIRTTRVTKFETLFDKNGFLTVIDQVKETCINKSTTLVLIKLIEWWSLSKGRVDCLLGY